MRIDGEDFEGAFEGGSIGANYEKLLADWTDGNGQFTPPIMVPEFFDLFRTRWKLGFELNEMSYVIFCDIKSWDKKKIIEDDDNLTDNRNNPSPYYPGSALQNYPLPYIDSTYMRDNPEMEREGNHYKDTVSMIANKLASKLLNDPYGNWRIEWEIHVPIFSGGIKWHAYFGESSLEDFESTDWESFQMSMPNPLEGLWSQSQEPQAVEDESYWSFRFVKHLDLQGLRSTWCPIHSDCNRLLHLE